ncbi:unnamed protein product [Peronospora belbahrii]|uniref:Polyprotein n=1 Tax=Peronospora belbahrii TaxID=622444 RepID=A0AAU9KWP2_9STRA|nr:unnamed protein product [Peronospora belbahrii]
MVVGLRELLGEIGVRVAKPMLMHVGNEAAIKQIQGEDSAGRAKHIAVRLKFIKDYSKKQASRVVYCEPRLIRSDLLTKAEIDRAVQVDLAGVKTSREDMLKGRNFSSEEVRLFM